MSRVRRTARRARDAPDANADANALANGFPVIVIVVVIVVLGQHTKKGWCREAPPRKSAVSRQEKPVGTPYREHGLRLGLPT